MKVYAAKGPSLKSAMWQRWNSGGPWILESLSAGIEEDERWRLWELGEMENKVKQLVGRS